MKNQRKSVIRVAHKSYNIEVFADFKRYYLFVNGKEYDFSVSTKSIEKRPLKALIGDDVIEARFAIAFSLLHPVTIRILVNNIVVGNT